VVISLSAGSRHGDAELRYALRSIEKHVEDLGRVWVIGHRPAWLRGVEHIPAGDPSRVKDVNILAKIEAACRAGVSERFLRFSDDQVILRPLAFWQFGPYTWGAVRPANGKANRWHRRLAATGDWLRRQGFAAWHCDTHAPIPMDRGRLLELAELCRDDWLAGDGFCISSWYVNAAEARPQAMGNRKATVEAALPAEQLRAAIAGRWFLGFNDAGFTGELRELLDELLPDRSRFEAGARASQILVKPAGPTLTITIPTIGRPTLRRTLDSIHAQQLVDGDEVLLVQDGPADEATRRVFEESGLPGRYLATGKRAADFGGTPRNLAIQRARGEYLAFLDDDDASRPGAFDAIRRAAVRHPERPLMFRMARPGWAMDLWSDQTVRHGNVSTQMFVAPNRPDRLGAYGLYYSGDLEWIATTLERWPPGALVWESATIAEVDDIHRPALAPFRRNLVYHVYPTAHNNEWRLNVARLRQSWDVFNGRRLIGLACDDSTVPVEEVCRAFGDDPTIEWLIHPNDRRRGEAVTFLPAFWAVRSWNATEATFYAHAKGVTPQITEAPPALRSIRRWRNLMYRACLDIQPSALDKILRKHGAAGCLKARAPRQETGRPPCRWFYAGTFFWVNHAAVFSLSDWLTLGPSRWAVERHLGEIMPDSHAYAFDRRILDPHTPAPGISRWDDERWDRLERFCDGPLYREDRQS